MIKNSVKNEDKIFGKKVQSVEYIERIGVYGVVINNEGKVAVIKTLTGYILLPGGGIENIETHKECLKREFLEEIGYQINIKKYIGKASMYHLSKENKYLCGIGHFYIVNLECMTDNRIEEDKELIWIDPYNCTKYLSLEHQSWAVLKAIGYKF